MMTLDKAIEHAEWCVENSCGECADDHKQLAEWLRELVTLRKIIAIREDTTWQAIHEHEELKSLNASLMGAAQGLGALCDRYKTENERLRDLVDLMLSCPMDKGDCDKCRQLNDMCEVEVLAGELGIEV